MLQGNVHVELMLLYRCSSERNDFISYCAPYSSSSQQRKLITSNGPSLIGHKQAAQQVEEATTKVSGKIASFNGAPWTIQLL